MHLTAKLANTIILEINGIIRQKINIMDESGIIIASTDQDRVGEFHEGAKEIIENQLEELIIRYDGEFQGAKCGVNYLIKILGKPIGVLGITGPYKEIESNAKIVKKLIELMLMNDYTRIHKQQGESIRNRYIGDWILGKQKYFLKDFMEQGLALGIDITVPRRFIVCTIMANKAMYIENSIEMLGAIEELEEKLIKMVTSQDRNNIYYKDNNAILTFGVTTMEDETLGEWLNQILNGLEKHDQISLQIGIDEPCRNHITAHEAYDKAKRANEVCQYENQWGYRFYQDLNIDIFANEINVKTKQAYIKSIFKGFSEEEIREAIVFLESYYEENGSLNQVSKKLFIHKNTIQYKLNKIQERTGYDPRVLSHSALFYNAIFFYKNLI